MEYNLTIGIPIHNEEESIEKCLNAILQSDLPKNTKIIICDNKSTDKSMEYVNRINKLHNNIIKIVKESKLGKIFAINKIIDESSSNYIVFCDADILVKKDSFKKMYQKLSTSNLHMIGVGLIDISQNRFFKWYYKQLDKIQKDDLERNVMGGCFGINKKKFGKFPPVLSTDFFMSAYYHFGNKKSMRYDSINVYYKKANTFWDILMKKTRNRLKYLQIKKDYPNLSSFQYERPIDYKKLSKNFNLNTFLAFLLHSSFETAAFIAGSIAFYIRFKKLGYSWRKAKSTKLEDINPSSLKT